MFYFRRFFLILGVKSLKKVKNEQIRLKAAGKTVLTSFWVRTAPKSWSKYTTFMPFVTESLVVRDKKVFCGHFNPTLQIWLFSDSDIFWVHCIAFEFLQWSAEDLRVEGYERVPIVGLILGDIYCRFMGTRSTNHVTDGMLCMNGTTSVPKSVLRYTVDFYSHEKPLMSIRVKTKTTFYVKICPNFLAFSSFLQLFHKKCGKTIFPPAFRVHSTHTLVEIYNNKRTQKLITFQFFFLPDSSFTNSSSISLGFQKIIFVHFHCGIHFLDGSLSVPVLVLC